MSRSHETNRSDLVIVSNRLPVQRVGRGGRTAWEASPGGLVSALTPILRDRRCTWIGWTGSRGDPVAPFDHESIRNVPVALSAAEVEAFYEGFSNRIIWPLYHDAVRPPDYRREWWQVYEDVNRRFAEMTADEAAPDAIVWIHDYHLQLMPRILRSLRPDVRIGFFLHIPFPPQELFAQLPWRREILEGLMGADVVGFQTRIGAANFSQVCRRFAEASGTQELLESGDRAISVGCFPISIDTAHFESQAASPEVVARREEIRDRLGRTRRIMLGIDRLDYTKGIDIRLHAFRELLASRRATARDCVLVQVAVPSREHVSEYHELRVKVERLVGEINGEFGDIGRTPVQYLHRSISRTDLSALYAAADVMLVTPLRDGMNLVSKEYVASRTENNGALILSEFTGAAKELTAAIQVNPHDIDGVVDAMAEALSMPPAEQTSRMRAMRRIVRRHDAQTWARGFFEALHHAHVG